MVDKIVLITGASDGIGKQAAKELAELGAHVIIHGRNRQKTEAAVNWIKQETRSEKIDMIIADMASFDQIRQMSRELHNKHQKIDVLINNAGVQMHNKEMTEDGFEYTFGVNHLAYFLTTSLLLDLVDKSDHKRILVVSSGMHADAIDFENLQAEKGYSLYPIYAVSKLCNLLFGYKLAKEVEGRGITVNCLHPGLIDTNLNPKRAQAVVDRALPVDQGTISTILLATSEDLEGVSGKYHTQNGSEVDSKPISYDTSAQEKLWNLSEEMIGEPFANLS